MKVWASREVSVLFKFEGPDPSSQTDDRERTLDHSGSGSWEELCFDFAGDTASLSTRAITFIFDLGVNGNATADPANWTFYFDDIQQVASCGGAAVPVSDRWTSSLPVRVRASPGTCSRTAITPR